MSESKAHMDFVRRIVEYASTRISTCDPCLVQADLPGYDYKTPKLLEGFIPDMYHKNSKCIIIGEAKTDNDIENAHTEAQLNSYIKEVRSYNLPRHIIVCSSVLSFAMLKNMILRKKRREHLDDITFHVLDVYSKESAL